MGIYSSKLLTSNLNFETSIIVMRVYSSRKSLLLKNCLSCLMYTSATCLTQLETQKSKHRFELISSCISVLKARGVRTSFKLCLVFTAQFWTQFSFLISTNYSTYAAVEKRSLINVAFISASRGIFIHGFFFLSWFWLFFRGFFSGIQRGQVPYISNEINKKLLLIR